MREHPQNIAADQLSDLLASRNATAIDGLLLSGLVSADVLLLAVDQFLKSERTRLQRAAANARHAKLKKAREWVNSHCDVHRVRFASKIKYAREASALVYRRFGVEVKPQTIARDWLPAGIVFGDDADCKEGGAAADSRGYMKPKRAEVLRLKK